MQKSIKLITAACHNAVKNLIVLRFVELVFIGCKVEGFVSA
jgi:hypothetical protein